MKLGRLFISTRFYRSGTTWRHYLVALHRRWRIAYVRPAGKPNYRRLYIGPVEIEWSNSPISSSDNQINSSGMPLSCSDKLQLGGLSFLLDQRAPSRTHFSLKRSTPVFVASWYPCSTPQQGQTSKTGVAPSSPQGGLKSQYPQTLQLCAFLIAKCHIPMPCQRNYRNSLRGKQFHRKENHKSHEPDLPASQRGVDGAPCKLRVARIGAIGNAVVPLIPEMIGNAILLAINSPMKSSGGARNDS